jgi:PAS domain S-box-containing protein
MPRTSGRRATWLHDGRATGGILITLALLALAGIASLLSLHQVGASARQVQHTQAVLRAVDSLHTALLDAEADQRGFLLSGDATYLAGCRAALPRARDADQQLRSLTQADPDQLGRLTRLEPLLDKRLALLRDAIDEGSNQVHPAAERPIKDENKSILDDLRKQLTALRDDELLRLGEWSERAEIAISRLSVATTLACTLAVIAAAGAVLLIQRNAGRRFAAEDALRRRDEADRHRELSQALVASEAARQRTDELMRGVLQAAPVAFIALDRGGRVQLWNPAAERAFGWSTAEMVGQPYPLVPAGKETEFQALVARAIGGAAVVDVETQWRARDGQLREVSVSAAPLRGPGGEAAGVLFVLADATERKALEAEVRRAQKLEAVGRLAGGVAHDFNNLLTVINSCCDLLRLQYGATGPQHELLDAVRSAGERAAALTRQLLAFSRRQILQPRLLDLNLVVADLVKLLGRLIGEDITLELSLEPKPLLVSGDHGQLEQVVMNLALNARDAMPHGGRLEIHTQCVDLDETFAATHLEVRPGPYALLAVHDTGSGMDEAVRSHLCEPFFTTKGPGKGTGLGLATVYAVVKQAGGAIDFASAPGAGTTVHIYLPRVDTAPPAEPAPHQTPSAGGAETVLVVEDEPGVRHLISEVLRSRGYTVLEASNGIEALRVASAHMGPMHLLVTDVVMPHLSGRALAEHLTSLRPALKVLYLSGHTDDTVLRHGVQQDAAFLQKPFSPDDLARAVRATLAAAH